MTEQTPAPASDTAENDNPVTASDNAAPITVQTSSDDHRIPKARLDEEIAKRRTLEGELDEIAKGVLAEVPENLKPLIPEGLSPTAQISWFNNAKATGVFGIKTTVPTTDTGKPVTTLPDADLSNLSPEERISRSFIVTN